MREIFLARLDKVRPCLILTRTEVRPFRPLVTVAGITSSSRGLPSEVSVGPEQGIPVPSVVNLDDIQTVDVQTLFRLLGHFPEDREREITNAIRMTFDLL